MPKVPPEKPEVGDLQCKEKFQVAAMHSMPRCSFAFHSPNNDHRG